VYGLSPDIDLDFLNGREVIQIAIGLFQVQFAFDADVRISVQSEFCYYDGNYELTWKPEPNGAATAASTVTLLGATVTNFTAERDGTLAVAFSNGQKLTIRDNSKQYESYSITAPGRNIYV